MFKKLSSLFVSLLLMVALSGCQTDSEPIPVSETDSVETVEVEATESESTESTEVETSESESTESVEVEVDETTEVETSEPAEATVASVTVVGTDFKFSPASLSFTAGETVQLTFVNEGNAPHNFEIEGTDLETETIGSGETTVYTFTAPAAGTYTTYCGVGGHRDAGMEGTLVTE